MSIGLFDLGNTRLKCAQLQVDGTPGSVTALGHDAAGFVDALRAHLPAQAESACLASVASPALTAAVVQVLSERFRRISLVRTQGVFAGVRVAYPTPSRLGVDRFLALVAAHARGVGPCLVVGVGTALTVDVLDAHGGHAGGRIAPSPQLMRQALHRAAAQLPEAGGDYVEFARDTDDALASGCDGAAIALIERSLQLAAQQWGTSPRLLIHGGGAQALLHALPGAEMAPTLVLEGVAAWARAGIGPAAPLDRIHGC